MIKMCLVWANIFWKYLMNKIMLNNTEKKPQQNNKCNCKIKLKTKKSKEFEIKLIFNQHTL